MRKSAALEHGFDAGGRTVGLGDARHHARPAAEPRKPRPRRLPVAAGPDDMETLEFSEAAPILHAIAMAEASDESLYL